MKVGPNKSKQAVSACRHIRSLTLCILVFCSLIQLLIEPTLTNIISTFLVLFASIATFYFIIRANIFRKAPLPTLCVLSFNFCTMSGALIAQTLDWRPLSFNLQVPEITFAACTLFQISLLVTLYLFIAFPALNTISRTINSRLLKPMGLMSSPSHSQLWLMGILGAGVMFWTSTVMYSGTGIQYGDVIGKFLFGLTFLAYAPFLIPILPVFSPNDRYTNLTISNKLYLIIYFFILLVIAIARNSRGAFAMGFANLGLALLLAVLLGQVKLTKKIYQRILVSLAILLILAPVFTNLAIAMVVVRSERGSIPATELISRTFWTAMDHQALENYRQSFKDRANSGDYEEYYLDNPFLARLINTKFADNCLALKGVRAGRYSGYLWDITLKKIMALLPTPVLKLLGSSLNKKDINFSMGSAMYYAEYGIFPGPFAEGNLIAHGIGLIGPYFFVMVIPLLLIVFIVLQALTSTVNGFIIIAPVILLQFMQVYYLTVNDSLLVPIAFILRDLPQDIFIYWLVFNITRYLSKRKMLFHAYPPKNISSVQSKVL